jgi:hypothetical protein
MVCAFSALTKLHFTTHCRTICPYSFLNEFTGLEWAARNAWVETIISANNNAIPPVIGKTHQGISIR